MLGIKAWHNLALLYQQRQQLDLSAQAWRHVLDYDRSNSAAWHGLLDVLAAAKDIAGLEQISAPRPDQHVPEEMRLFARARLAAQNGDAKAGVCELEAAAHDHPSVELLNELCELAFKNELFDVAERGIAELTRRSPEDPSACHNRALLCLRRSDYAEAARWARRSLELRPNYEASRQLMEQATRLLKSNGTPQGEASLTNVRIGESLIGDEQR